MEPHDPSPLSDIALYDRDAALAALIWLQELGVSEAIGDAPFNAYEAPDRLAPLPEPAAPPVMQAPTAGPQSRAPQPPPPKVEGPKPAELAQNIALSAPDLATLSRLQQDFEPCDLRKGARRFVFGDGLAEAELMVITDPPDREEEREGRPLVGEAGALFDLMLKAIGRDRRSENASEAAYLVPAVPWRILGDREPESSDLEMLRPFLLRHIALARPKVVIAASNTACAALLGQSGISRLRGQWHEAAGVPVMPMFSPAFLLRSPIAKREAWADLRAVRAKLT